MKNSPLVKRKGYEVLDSKKKDPFIKGINFNLQYYASAEVQDNHNSPAVQEKVREMCEERRSSSKSFRKVMLTVKAHCLTVTDVATKIVDSYPIFLVAYCGGHGEIDDCFFFIHKTKLEKKMMVEIFRCANEGKVKAITLTVAKAFNISYKAWLLEKKKRERANGSNGGLPQKKGSKSSLVKMAPGVASGGTYTPPVTRKPPSGDPEGAENGAPRGRSGSLGDKPAPKNPAVVRSAMAHNEITGSTHNVTLTDEFDQEFQALAESRTTGTAAPIDTQPGVLRTSFSEDTDYFSFDNIKEHIDVFDD